MYTNNLSIQPTALGAPQVTPVAPTSGVTSSSSHSSANGSSTWQFGPDYIRETDRHTEESFPMYTQNGELSGNSEPFARQDMAEERTVKNLEQRDQEVRRKEEAKGEAVGSRAYIYQTGPDGERYAIGTAAHTVRQGDNKNTDANAGVDSERANNNDGAQLEKLRERDRKVRAHETAHLMAANGQAQGMATYTYQTGPDGKRYAIGGSVNISMTRTGNSEHDARQARNAYRAAMATGEPSAQDMQTARLAQTREHEAKQNEDYFAVKNTATANAMLHENDNYSAQAAYIGMA